MAEHEPAERTGEEADAEGGERRQRTDARIELGEEQLVEHQRGRGAVDEEVVPFERRADRGGQHHAAQR